MYVPRTLDGGGTLVAEYLHGDGVDEVIGRYDRTVPSGESHIKWLLADQQGSVRDVVNAVGTVMVAMEYDAYGVQLSQTNVGSVGDPAGVCGRHRLDGPAVGRGDRAAGQPGPAV